jgi:hypothetical protein
MAPSPTAPNNYRPEHVFALRQSLAAFRYYQHMIVEADQEINVS